MRNVLKSSSEVFHFFANKVQSAGRANSVFFENDTLYSYGKHFAVAKHIAPGTVAFTTRGYSNTTAKHISQARSACRHLKIVYCNDPTDSAVQNMRHAQDEIVEILNSAEKPRIRQATRDGLKFRALTVAETANVYLMSLPESERDGIPQIDTKNLEFIRETMNRFAEVERQQKRDKEIARNKEAAERLQAWKIDLMIPTIGFYNLPVALRLSGQEWNRSGADVIETSHGAQIPVSFAARLWAMIQATMSAGRDLENINRPCGVYTLNTIRADGSIVVGCHDIPFSEIKDIATQLDFLV